MSPFLNKPKPKPKGMRIPRACLLKCPDRFQRSKIQVNNTLHNVKYTVHYVIYTEHLHRKEEADAEESRKGNAGPPQPDAK